MKSSDLINVRPPKLSKILLVILGLFTGLAAIGYATFGLHPEWLQVVPRLAGFYGTAFLFFAQGQVWISVIVLLIYLRDRVGWQWLGAFVLIYAISLGSELAGTRFGIPFGDYAYTDLLGGKWFGRVPYLIPLSWFTMTIPAYALAKAALPSARVVYRIALAAFLLALWDLSLDPAMSYLTNYWLWDEPGFFYGMPLVNLAGWYGTGLVLMSALYAIGADSWIDRLNIRWTATYYLLVLAMPFGMVLASGLWGAVAATLLALLPIGWLLTRRFRNGNDGGALPDSLSALNMPEGKRDGDLSRFFKAHSSTFSFAARFFSPEQYRLVSHLYAFCRTTDDFADRYAAEWGVDIARQRLDDWEKNVRRAYDGYPSGLRWLDDLMAQSARAGVPYTVISDLIAGVRSDLGEVNIASVEELNQYTYRVASVVGIWLCYLFGVREREVLDRAAALGRAMQVTNILRDVGEDVRMGRVYLPGDLMLRHYVSHSDLKAMESGTIAPTESYKAMLEDLMERAEADYSYAFRGLTAIPPSFARAAAVAAEVYRGIHQALRKKRYNNFRYRAYTRWFDKIFLAFRALYRLRQMQKRPFLPNVRSVYLAGQHSTSKNGSSKTPLIAYLIILLFLFTGAFFGSSAIAAQSDRTAQPVLTMQDTTGLLQRVRELYLAGVDNEQAIAEGMAVIEASGSTEPAQEAYRGALIVLKAKHAFWPHQKMNFLREGLPVLDSLVARHPEFVEIRYLRLLSCYYLPRFLGRSDSVRDDLMALRNLLPGAQESFPKPLYQDMVRFVSINDHMIREERAKDAIQQPQPARQAFSKTEVISHDR